MSNPELMAQIMESPMMQVMIGCQRKMSFCLIACCVFVVFLSVCQCVCPSVCMFVCLSIHIFSNIELLYTI